MSVHQDMSLLARLGGLEIEALSVLDLGCGYNRNRISRVVLELPFSYLTSVDIHQPCLDALRERTVAASVHYIVWNDLLHYLGGTAEVFDVTLLLDVLEHFDESNSGLLLAFAEAVTHKRIIIFLPLGTCPQGTYDGNPYQAHLSSWEASDLRELGYTVEVLPGFHKNFTPLIDAAWAVKNL